MAIMFLPKHRRVSDGLLSGRPFVFTLFTAACKLVLVLSQPQNAPGYLGCYKDCDGGCYNRALPIGPVDSDHQSVELCFKHCQDERTSSYKYAGLEYEHQCFCGNDENYGRFGKKADSECQDRCTGNDDQYCGDSKRISIYRISQGVCSNDIGPPTNGSHVITNPRSLSYNLNNFKFFGTRVDFSCDPGYTLHGASSIECIETDYNNVTWSDSVPTCEVPTTSAHLTTGLSKYTTPKSITPTQTTTTAYTKGSNNSQPLTGYTTDVGIIGNNQTTGELQTRTIERTSTEIVPPTCTMAPDDGTNSPIAGKLGTGEVAGIAVGALAAFTVLIVAVAFLWRKRIRKPKELKGPDIVLDTVGAHYVNHTFANHLSDTSGTAQSQGDSDNAPPVYYSHVITKIHADEGATLPVSPQNDKDGDSGWVDNEVYGCESFPIEIEARNKDRDGQTNGQPPITMEGKPEWVENIIYE